MSSNETRSAEAILLDVSAETGWNADSQRRVLLRYIEAQDNNERFAEFLMECGDDEMSL